MCGVLALQGTYVYLQPPSLEQLRDRVSADVLANPPLQHEPAEAAQAAAAEAAAEASAAAARRDLFDEVLVHDPQARSACMHGTYRLCGTRWTRHVVLQWLHTANRECVVQGQGLGASEYASRLLCCTNNRMLLSSTTVFQLHQLRPDTLPAVTGIVVSQNSVHGCAAGHAEHAGAAVRGGAAALLCSGAPQLCVGLWPATVGPQQQEAWPQAAEDPAAGTSSQRQEHAVCSACCHVSPGAVDPQTRMP
eukprot:GHRQ01027539.1.p1 GENE.GHRQ01027539.1~~GHRQ01027539.1.p1  ORF type:complete len:249 (+),score=51.84 GHRQ01027539.1:65-811(+)